MTLLLQRLETRPVVERPLVPLGRDEDGLRLLPTREHEALPEQPRLVDHLGEVGASLGHSHAHFVGRSHATTVHARPTSNCVALYNSGEGEAPVNNALSC